MENDQELIKEVYPISILRESQQNKDEGECWISEDVIKKWTDNPQGVSPEYPYEFCCTRHYTYKNIDNPSKGKEWQPWDTKNISLWAHYGMNAIPYQLLLGNPYESIYQIEASGATREAYVIIDGDGISTGEIILQGGYENKDQKFNLKIDEISILDPINNIERNFKDSNYKTINLGDNWYCRFELSDNNGNPVIKIIGIGPNPESAVTPPSTIELASTDSCFKCDLGGKYQKKIVIQAKNKQKNITAAATWTVTAIRDKNGDGIWRYQIMPNIDRVVRNVYYKRIGEDPKDVQVIKDKWNVGDASELRFDIEKDSYGKSWTDITNQECRLCILSQDDPGNILYHKLAMGGPITIPFDDIETIMNQLRGDNLLFPTIKQYVVCLQVVDPDYKIDSIIGEGKWSTVDKCNLVFEYIVSESGKDGEDGENGKDGKDGTSSVFNLSNDSGSFAYDYKTNGENCTIILNDNDKTTDIQYKVESNYKCCDSIKIGKTLYEKPGEGSYVSEKQGTIKFKLTKNTEYWTLEITDIITSQYKSVFAIPITGVLLGKEVGTATFKMVGIKDLDGNGIYAYRLACEHPYSTENSSTTDFLDIDVYKDALVEGFGYNTETKVLVRIFSKKSGDELSPNSKKLGTVSCKTPKKGLRTGVSMYTVQLEHGVIVKLYAADEDYKNDSDKITVEDTIYYFTGEAEDIPWTAPQGIQGPSVEVDYEELKNSIKTISCSNDNIVVIPGKKYTFTFKDIAGKNISEKISFEGYSDFFTDFKGEGGIYELTAKTNITSDPSIGTITYQADGYPTPGEITYTWVGDANSDGVYYDYEIQPSAQVLGYTEVDGNLAFNIGKITITCKSVKHEGVLKTSTLGSGYILVGSNKIEGNNFGQLDKNGQVTITLGEPPKESTEGSTEESKKLYYSKKTSFRVYWFTADNDYATAAESTDIPFIEIGIGTEKKKYYQVDSELIDVVPNTAIDATTNLQAYTGSGTFIVDPKTLKATFEYKSDAPGYYLVRFNKAQYQGTGDIYFANTTVTPTQPNTVKVIMGPELMRTTTTSTEEQLTLTNINGPYGLGNYQETVETSTVAWIKCPSVHVGIYKENTFKTLLFEDTVVRTGLDGYYWNVNEDGWVSVQSNGDAMTSINQTANSIVSIASGVSPNLCKGAATDKTSPFTWVTGSDGEEVTSYHNYKRITAPNTGCDPIGTGLLVSTSDNQCTYYKSDFKLNEGYYGISLSPNKVTEGGTIDVGYDGPLISDNYGAPSGKAIAISSKYNGKGIKFTVPETLLGNDCILSFYASQTDKGTVYVKANNNTYQFTTTNSVKRYVLKLNNLSSREVTIYKDQSNDQSSILYISSIQFEKGSLVTDWKDYGQDVSTIIQEASRIRSEVERISGDYASKSSVEQTANGIKTEVATIKGNQAELESSINQTAGEIRAQVEEINGKYGTLKSYIDEKPTGIDMATVVNGIRTAGINIKNGNTEVEDGVITQGQGSVELTGQVIATNFMVKKSETETQKINEFIDNKDIVMCITTWGIAKTTLGYNNDITLKDEAPVFIIKSGEKYFVLNPLLLNDLDNYPARYQALNMKLFRFDTSISVNTIITTDSKIVYQYLEPSYKLINKTKVYNIEGAENQKDVICINQDYENLAADPPTFNKNSLLNSFALIKIDEITAPVYSNSFITFVPMDVYKVRKYIDGNISEDGEHTIFIGNRIIENGGKITLSNDKQVLYKLGEIPKLDTITKTKSNSNHSGQNLKFTYIETKGPNRFSKFIFITKIEDSGSNNTKFKGVEFKYVLKVADSQPNNINDLINTYYSSKNLETFTDNEKNYFDKWNINVKYKEFLDSKNTGTIGQIYGILPL